MMVVDQMLVVSRKLKAINRKVKAVVQRQKVVDQKSKVAARCQNLMTIVKVERMSLLD